MLNAKELMYNISLIYVMTNDMALIRPPREPDWMYNSKRVSFRHDRSLQIEIQSGRDIRRAMRHLFVLQVSM